MVFSSIPFLFVFFPIVFALYFIVPKKAKNYCLLCASLIFYAWGEPIYVFLMILTCLVGYYSAIAMEKYQNKKKIILILTVIFDLAILGFFKYSNFAIETLNSIANTDIKLLSLSLPIGISFYTFQILSYSVDVYRKDVKAEKNFFYFTTYVSLFPQLIAGPIVRYETISKELHERTVTLQKFSDGFTRFIVGLAKKVIIANALGTLNTNMLDSTSPSTLFTWLGVIAFGLQIYFDFSAYSDMAIGMGKMLGFNFLENFNYPYMATTITDFWRRWHISLSTFFKDYVYISLGGNRCSKTRNIVNILIVWSLTGLWHGAHWNFVIWGIYFAILLILEKFVFKRILEKTPIVLKRIYTLFLVSISWAIFMCDNSNDFILVFKQLFGVGVPFSSQDTLYNLRNFIIVLVISIIGSMPLMKNIYLKLKEKASTNKTKRIVFDTICLLVLIIFLLVSVAYLVNNSYNPFLYFRF